VSDNSDEHRVHETLLPSLTLSVLGGMASEEGVTPLPAGVTPLPVHAEATARASGTAQPVDAPLQDTGPVIDTEAEMARPRGARRGDMIGGRYVVDGQIGRGGMGRVLRVRHQVLGKAFALKLIKVPIATNPRIREMFYREARLASALSHQNICSIVDFGQDPLFGLFMVMELLEGQTIHNKLRHDGRLAPKVACDVMWQIAEALRYIHGRAIIHGDVKSENILLMRTPDRRRVVKLLDFGLARAGIRETTTAKQVEGTPEYLAPERIRGAPASPSSDIYALGILFYELLVGKLPFVGDLDEVFQQHLDTNMPLPSQQIDEPIDERADEIVARATAKDPEDRHPDVAGFLYELRTFMNMLGMDVARRRAGAGGGGGSGEKSARRAANRETQAAREVFDNAPVPLASVDPDGKVRAANQAFLEFLGVAGAAAGIQLTDSGFAEVYPALIDDLQRVANNRTTRKRIIYLSEGGGHVVEVAVILTAAPNRSEVTAGDIHMTLHPLNRY
jgi:PAS domain-containing protein